MVGMFDTGWSSYIKSLHYGGDLGHHVMSAQHLSALRRPSNTLRRTDKQPIIRHSHTDTQWQNRTIST